MIYDELLHIKALSHLSTMVKRELAGVLVFEAHWNWPEYWCSRHTGTGRSTGVRGTLERRQSL